MLYYGVDDVYSIGCRLNNLAQSMTTLTLPTGDLQKAIQKQLQEFLVQIAHHEKFATENSTLRQSNDTLVQQLDTDRECMNKLIEEINALNRKEEDSQTRRSQLESRLADADENIQCLNADAATANNCIVNLQRQIRNFQKEKNNSQADIDQLEQRLRACDEVLNASEVSAGKHLT